MDTAGRLPIAKLILEQNEQPVENVKVELASIAGEVLGVALTGSKGEFEFNGLSNGEFILYVREPDFMPVRQSVAIFNSVLNGLVIYLRRVTVKSQGESVDPVTVRELSLPRDAQSNYRKGLDMLYRKRDPESGLKLLQKVVVASPDFYEGHFQIGVAYDMLHKPGEAEAAFRKSIATSSEKYPHALIALASLLALLDPQNLAFIVAYIFGREYKEGTEKNMLTVPIRREYSVIAKMIVVACWVFGLALFAFVLQAGGIAAMGVKGFAWSHVFKSLGDLLQVTLLLYLTLPLVAWIAMAGRG